MRPNRRTVRCWFCGTSITRPVSLLANAKRHFCSRDHQGKWFRTQTGLRAGGWRGGGVEKTCEVCAQPFRVRRSQADLRRCCSRRCKGRHDRSLVGPMAGNWKGLGKKGLRERARLRDGQRRAVYSDGSFDLAAWERLKDEAGRKCLCCGTPESERPLTPDHIVPIARGGAHEADNIQPLCLPCNMEKHAKIIDFADGFEITDVAIVPAQFMKPSMAKIQTEVERMGDATSIPGVRIYEEKVMGAGRRS